MNTGRDSLGRFKKGYIPWIKGKHQTAEAKRKLALASKGNHHRAVKPNLEMSDSLAYIAGVIYGDGYLQYNKGTWIIGLHVSKLEFAESFRNALIKIGLKPSRIRTSLECSEFSKVAKQRYRVITYSYRFHDFFQSLSLDELKNKLCIKQSLIWAFLRGFYESEGTRLYRKGHGLRVVVAHNTNYKLIQLAGDLLTHLGFSYSVFIRKAYDNRKPLYRLILGGPKHGTKENFLKSLAPCIKRCPI